MAYFSACGSDENAGGDASPTSATVLDLDDVKSNPTAYEWFDFRPNVKKLILAGAAETEHVAILWYTTPDGSVGLHYHSRTESVYVIEGAQTDDKGVYPTGTVYFNPPGSGHAIRDSSGFFLLAYAAPPDFTSTDAIEEYTPVRIDARSSELTSLYSFEERQTGVRVFAAPLDQSGGMSAELIQVSSTEPYAYTGNYLLVLDGPCAIDGRGYEAETLVVTKGIEPASYSIAAPASKSCLALGVSF